MEISFRKATEILRYDQKENYYNLADYDVPCIRTDELLNKYDSKAEVLKEIKKALSECEEEGILVCFLDEKMLVQVANKGWNVTPILFKAYAQPDNYTHEEEKTGRLHMVTLNRGRGALSTYWTDLWVKPDTDMTWLREKQDFSVVLTGDFRNYNCDYAGYSTCIENIIEKLR